MPQSIILIELGKQWFWNQRTRVSKNSYVAKNQTKMPGGVKCYTLHVIRLTVISMKLIFNLFDLV